MKKTNLLKELRLRKSEKKLREEIELVVLNSREHIHG